MWIYTDKKQGGLIWHKKTYVVRVTKQRRTAGVWARRCSSNSWWWIFICCGLWIVKTMEWEEVLHANIFHPKPFSTIILRRLVCTLVYTCYAWILNNRLFIVFYYEPLYVEFELFYYPHHVGSCLRECVFERASSSFSLHPPLPPPNPQASLRHLQICLLTREEHLNCVFSILSTFMRFPGTPLHKFHSGGIRWKWKIFDGVEEHGSLTWKWYERVQKRELEGKIINTSKWGLGAIIKWNFPSKFN